MANGLFKENQESDLLRLRSAGQRQTSLREESASDIEALYNEEEEEQTRPRSVAPTEGGTGYLRSDSDDVGYLGSSTDEATEYLRSGSADSTGFMDSDRLDPDLDISQNPYAMNIDFDSGLSPAQEIRRKEQELREEEEKSGMGRARGIVNFLFSEEMGILGMKWDRDGFHTGMDVMTQQWSEHPVLSSFALAGAVAQVAFPVWGAIKKSAKVGMLAQKGISVGKHSSLLRTAVRGQKFNPADEIVTMAKASEWADEVIPGAKVGKKVLDAADEPGYAIQEALGLGEHGALRELGEEVAERMAGITGGKGDDTAEVFLKSLKDPDAAIKGRYFTQKAKDEILKWSKEGKNDLITKKYGRAYKKALLAEDRLGADMVLRHKILNPDSSPYGTPTARDRVLYGFKTRFANSYMNALMKPNAPAIAGYGAFFMNSNIPQLMTRIPDSKVGPSLQRYMANIITKDEYISELGKLGIKKTDEVLAWSDEVVAAKVALQEAKDKAGFLFADEVAQAKSMAGGRSIHLPALRPDTPAVGAAQQMGGLTLEPRVKYIAKEMIAPNKKDDFLAWYNKVQKANNGRVVDSFDDIPPEKLTNMAVVQSMVRAEGGEDILKSVFGSPTLKKKLPMNQAEYAEAIKAGKVITDPMTTFNTGYVRDTQLFHAHQFMTEALQRSMDNPSQYSQFFRSSVADLPANVRNAEWVPLSKLDEFLPDQRASERVLNMLNKTREGRNLAPLTRQDLPYVSKDFLDQFVDPDVGMLSQIDNVSNLFNMITTIHKTARTALNPGTHLQNIGGNLVFLSMAGYNITNPFKARERFEDGAVISKVFSKIAAKKTTESKKLATVVTKINDMKPGQTIDDVLSAAERSVWDGRHHFKAERYFEKNELTQIFAEAVQELGEKGTPNYGGYSFKLQNGKATDVILKTKDGTELNVVDWFSTPALRQTIEESAFDSIEGFSALQNMWEKLAERRVAASGVEGFASARGQQITEDIASFIAKYMGKIGGAGKAGQKILKREALEAPPIGPIQQAVEEFTNFENLLHKGSSWYLAEDVVPKMMFALEQAKSGLSIDQVVMEVGRRLPQYQAVGTSIGSARRALLPWITFPAEATRIMKNNLMDHPLRTLPWMQAPGILQTALSYSGAGPSADEFLGMPERGIPPISEQMAPWAMKEGTVVGQEGVIAPLAGAITGGLAGGAFATWNGASPLTAAAAFLGGAALGGAAGQYGVNIDPGNSPMRSWVLDFIPSTAAIWNPGTRQLSSEPRTMRQLLDISPVEPLSTIMPLINAISGEGSFGRELPPEEGVTGMISTTLMALMGFMAPPFIQKYGMKVEGLRGQYGPTIDLTDSGDLLDLNEGSPTIDVDISLLGEFGSRVQGAVAGGVLGAATSRSLPVALGTAAVGGLMGTKINNKRLFQDLGLIGNDYTKKPGNPIYDILFNTFGGLPKTWEVDPLQGAVNERFRRLPFNKKRTYYKKQLEQAIEQDNEELQQLYLEKIGQSFTNQYLDPRIAAKKFKEWKKDSIKTIGRIRALASYSQEEILRMMAAADDFAIDSRSKAAEAYVLRLRQELMSRKINSKQASKNRINSKRGEITTRYPRRSDPVERSAPLGRSGIFR